MAQVPADKVIRIFGGVQAVATLLDLSRIQIFRWRQPKAKGGHAGRVPQRHHDRLIEEAKRLGKRLTLADLNPPGLPPLGKTGPKPRTGSEAA